MAKSVVAMRAEEKVQVIGADEQDMKASCKEEDEWRPGRSRGKGGEWAGPV